MTAHEFMDYILSHGGFQNGFRGGNELAGVDTAKKPDSGLVLANKVSCGAAFGQPLTETGVWPEPGNGWGGCHHGQMQWTCVAAEMQRAVLDHGSQLQQIQIARKDTPGRLRQ